MNMTAQVQARPAPTPSFAPMRANLLQRECACGGTPGLDGECAGCRQKRLSRQRYSMSQARPTAVPPIVHEVLRSPGQPLDMATRNAVEPHFGYDFSQVRVHTDARAAESARSVDALAYATGHDVVFGGGQYAPGTSAGRRLLAHELTHVVQQSDGRVSGAAIVRDATLEREADRQGDRIARGESAHEDFGLGRTNYARGGLPNPPHSAGTATGGSPTGANLDLARLGNPLTAGMIPGERIQLDEEPDEGGTGEAVDDEGGLCLRLWIPGMGGRVSWSGIDQETLDRNVRLKPEDSSTLEKANADDTDTLDAIYFGRAFGRGVYKVPDHCTAEISDTLGNISYCCNLAGQALAWALGRDTVPRWTTGTEFGVENDWEPE